MGGGGGGLRTAILASSCKASQEHRQRLGGRVLDLTSNDHWFEPHRRSHTCTCKKRRICVSALIC